MGAHDYNRAPVGEKQAYHRDRMREPAITCPYCETRTTVAGLLSHLDERCKGRRAVHRLSKWVNRAQAIELDVAPSTLQRWAALGWVRTRGRGRRRAFLLRDLVSALALRRHPMRGRKPERRAKPIAKRSPDEHPQLWFAFAEPT